MTEIPLNATIRQEYVKRGNPDCQNHHGPYLYAYWKQDKKLNKRYIGKHLEDFRASQANISAYIAVVTTLYKLGCSVSSYFCRCSNNDTM
jgi:hypothetical protein